MPELEQNWTEKRIQLNLPKSVKLTAPPTKHKTLKPEELKLQIYRNAREQTPLPNTLDKTFLENALNPKEISTGLKFIIPPAEDPHMIHALLVGGLIIIKSRHVIYLENDEFCRLPRISHNGSPQ